MKKYKALQLILGMIDRDAKEIHGTEATAYQTLCQMLEEEIKTDEQYGLELYLMALDRRRHQLFKEIKDINECLSDKHGHHFDGPQLKRQQPGDLI